jgi:D-sedoheptulose 7-phosphate isomerase
MQAFNNKLFKDKISIVMEKWMKNYVEILNQNLNKIPFDKINEIIKILGKANKEKRQIFVFGNGGSASTSSHFITDLGKSASDKLPDRFRCISLNDNTAWITAIGNDYSFEDIFLFQLKNYAQPGDVVMTMSVSGSSPNLVKAFKWAKANGLETIALVGGKKGKLAGIADHVVVIDSEHYGIVEDAHMVISHLLCYAFIEHPEVIK